MRTRMLSGLAAAGLLCMASAANATPVSTLSPLVSDGANVYAIYLFSLAGDTLNLSEIGPNSVSNIFCNYSNGSCSAALSGQTVYLGNPGPGLVFALTDVSNPATYTTNALASDGYAHDVLSPTVSASDPAAVNAAFETLGFGAIASAYADPIAALGRTPGTSVTFVEWEDRIGGDYDYNDFVFAFTDPPSAIAAPEPMTLAMFGFGLAALVGFGRRVRKT
jgi:hypothetical protein